MKIRTRVKLVRKTGQNPYYAVYLIDPLNQERLVQLSPFKYEADPDDKYWGENTAKQEIMNCAKRLEGTQIEDGETIIYETPTEP